MSPFALVSAIVGLFMAQRLVDLYYGGHYICPTCGTRSESRHSSGCPWGGSPSG